MTTVNVAQAGFLGNVSAETASTYKIDELRQLGNEISITNLPKHQWVHKEQSFIPVLSGIYTNKIQQSSGSATQETSSVFILQTSGDDIKCAVYNFSVSATACTAPKITTLTDADFKAIIKKQFVDYLTKTKNGLPNGRTLSTAELTKIDTILGTATYLLDGKPYATLADIKTKWMNGECANYYRLKDLGYAAFLDKAKVNVNGGRDLTLTGREILQLTTLLCVPEKSEIIQRLAGKNEENPDAMPDYFVDFTHASGSSKTRAISPFHYARSHNTLTGAICIPMLFGVSGTYPILNPQLTSTHIQITIMKKTFDEMFEMKPSMCLLIKESADLKTLNIPGSLLVPISCDDTTIIGANVTDNQMYLLSDVYHESLVESYRRLRSKTLTTHFVTHRYQIEGQIITMTLTNITGFLKTIMVGVHDPNTKDGAHWHRYQPFDGNYVYGDVYPIGAQTYRVIKHSSNVIPFDPQINASIGSVNTHSFTRKIDASIVSAFDSGEIKPPTDLIPLPFTDGLDSRGLPSSAVGSIGQKTISLIVNEELVAYAQKCRQALKPVPEIVIVTQTLNTLESKIINT